jgi:large subunit ribosomal protein L10
LPSEQILLKKRELSSQLAEKIKEYPAIMVIGIQGASGHMMSELRARLRGLGEVKVAKNSVVVRALTSLQRERPGIEKLTDLMKGSNAIILSKVSPFLVSTTVEEIKQADWIKSGATAKTDVVIPAGDLGLPPGGPATILTDMGAKTRIVKGMLRLDEDFTLIRAGEKVSAAAAALLMALDIRPIQLSFEIKGAWDGIFIPGEELHIDIEKYERDLTEARMKALTLAVESEIFTDESTPLILQRAAQRAVAMAQTGAFYAPDELELALKKAASSAALVKALANL